MINKFINYHEANKSKQFFPKSFLDVEAICSGREATQSKPNHENKAAALDERVKAVLMGQYRWNNEAIKSDWFKSLGTTSELDSQMIKIAERYNNLQRQLCKMNIVWLIPNQLVSILN